MLRYLAAQGVRFVAAGELAEALAKKPMGGNWNSGIAILRNNGLIEAEGRRYRAMELLQLTGAAAERTRAGGPRQWPRSKSLQLA